MPRKVFLPHPPSSLSPYRYIVRGAYVAYLHLLRLNAVGTLPQFFRSCNHEVHQQYFLRGHSVQSTPTSYLVERRIFFSGPFRQLHFILERVTLTASLLRCTPPFPLLLSPLLPSLSLLSLPLQPIPITCTKAFHMCLGSAWLWDNFAANTTGLTNPTNLIHFGLKHFRKWVHIWEMVEWVQPEEEIPKLWMA